MVEPTSSSRWQRQKERFGRLHRWLWRHKLYPVLLVLFLVLLPFLRHDMNHYAIRGVDVSRYQSSIDWELLTAQDKLHFIFIKATEGQSYIDPTFKKRWQAAREHGLIRGAYHYYQPNKSGYEQARHFIQTVPLKAGDLPPVLDIEDLYRVSSDRVIKGVKEWSDLIQERYAIRPIIYTSLHWYQQYLGEAFPDHIFWVARYARQQPPVQWTFWQYSSGTYVDGIKERVDGNVFVGTRWQLEQLCL